MPHVLNTPTDDPVRLDDRPRPTAASFDVLTGLYNRQHMLEALQRELAWAAQSGRHFAAVIANLDDFGQVNATLGQAVGDEALESFAGIAREVLRDVDILGRWAGAEFLFLLPDQDPAKQSTTSLQRLRATLDNAVVSIRRPALRLRFSAGVALPGPGESAESVLARAGNALQQAKHQGQDRTVIAS